MGTAEIGILSGVLGTVVGLIIGYYKANLENTEKIEKYVKKEDCIRCAEERVRKFTDFETRLSAGAALFSKLETSLEYIKQSIEEIKEKLT